MFDKTLFTLVVEVFLLASVSAIKYSDCGSLTGKVTDVRVSGCEDSDVCQLKRGTSASIAIDFQSLEDISSLKAVVHGVIAGVGWPFAFSKPNACVDSGLECPLQNGDNHNYSAEIEVQKSYPAVKVDVKWELKDSDNENVVCVLIPSQLV